MTASLVWNVTDPPHTHTGRGQQAGCFLWGVPSQDRGCVCVWGGGGAGRLLLLQPGLCPGLVRAFRAPQLALHLGWGWAKPPGPKAGAAAQGSGAVDSGCRGSRLAPSWLTRVCTEGTSVQASGSPRSFGSTTCLAVLSSCQEAPYPSIPGQLAFLSQASDLHGGLRLSYLSHIPPQFTRRFLPGDPN